MLGATLFGMGWLALIMAVLRLVLRLDRMFVETLSEIEMTKRRLANARSALRLYGRQSLNARRDRNEARRRVGLEAADLAHEVVVASTDVSTEAVVVMLNERRRQGLDRLWCARVPTGREGNESINCAVWADSETSAVRRIGKECFLSTEQVTDVRPFAQMPQSA